MKLPKEEFLLLMQFPKEWLEWGMYPDNEFFEGQLSCYEPEDENAPEHFRNGAFHWWLKRNPTKEQLKKLLALTFLDPDPPMAESVRRHIAKSGNCDKELFDLLTQAKRVGWVK